MADANVAVLIDYENVGMSAIEYLLDQLSDVGRVIIKRAYADWSVPVQRGKQDQLLELGIEPIHQYLSNRSGKNSSDIRLAIDAIDILYGSPVDTFVIVSSDSDFVPLIGKLRAVGKTIIGAGRREATSTTLVKSCDRYIYLDDAAPSTSANTANARRRRSPTTARPAEPASLLIRAVEASTDDRGQVVGSKLYQSMLRIDPSFNFRTKGHRTFAQYLESDSRVKIVRPRDGGDLVVQLAGTPDQINGSRSPADEKQPDAAQAVASGSTEWDKEIDQAWASRERSNLTGPAAASDAAKVLGAEKLSVSKFPSLEKLLGASNYLRSKWRREGNKIIKK
ncbi:MAG: NYN domain-containing protein [Chloroflexi bacterium]|nr:NYN domain-containing protein [Chloroflexota bacterium]